MCKIVEDYGKQKRQEGRQEGRAEGELMKAVDVVRAMVADKVALETALRYAQIDLKTYKKYSDNN